MIQSNQHSDLLWKKLIDKSTLMRGLQAMINIGLQIRIKLLFTFKKLFKCKYKIQKIFIGLN